MHENTRTMMFGGFQGLQLLKTGTVQTGSPGWIGSWSNVQLIASSLALYLLHMLNK